MGEMYALKWYQIQFYFSLTKAYSVFHRIRQAKFYNGGLILSPSQISLLPQLCQKNKARVKSGQNRHKNNHLTTF